MNRTSYEVRRGLSGCLALVGLTLAIAAQAQEGSGLSQDSAQSLGALRFTTSNWSQIRPGRDYNQGCADGFLAFNFSPTGYFIFNRRTHGSWQVDQLGNLQLHTRDGERIRLTVSGTHIVPIGNSSFLKKTEIYQQCSLK